MHITKLAQRIHIVVPEFVLSIEKIDSHMEQLTSVLEQSVDTSNITQLSELLGELTSWYAIVPDLVASTKYYMETSYKLQYNELYTMIKEGKAPAELNGMRSPSVLKEYVRSRCAEFTWLYTKCDRLNSSITHRADALRTLISKEKELIRMNIGVNNN